MQFSPFSYVLALNTNEYPANSTRLQNKNLLHTELLNGWLLLVYGSDTSCSLYLHFTIAVFYRKTQKEFNYYYHQLPVLIREKYLRPEFTSERQSKG